MPSSAPDYVVCLECETPCYSFEFKDGEIKDVICVVCGEDDPAMFLAPDDFEALAEAP